MTPSRSPTFRTLANRPAIHRHLSHPLLPPTVPKVPATELSTARLVVDVMPCHKESTNDNACCQQAIYSMQKSMMVAPILSYLDDHATIATGTWRGQTKTLLCMLVVRQCIHKHLR